MKERRGKSRTHEMPVLPESVRSALDWLDKKVGGLMEGEDRKDALFRNMIVWTELGDVGKYITHDPTLNPRARPHGTRQEEIHAYGQLLVQVVGLMWARDIPFQEALAIGLQNWQERDWQKIEAKKETRVEGRVVYPGEVSGTAYVVSEERILNEFTKGVLVATFLKPDNFMFLNENRPLAIVTDNGGIASHPAILARELGITAIVGTGNATQLIPHGAEVLVKADGKLGTVTVVSSE